MVFAKRPREGPEDEKVQRLRKKARRSRAVQSSERGKAQRWIGPCEGTGRSSKEEDPTEEIEQGEVLTIKMRSKEISTIQMNSKEVLNSSDESKEDIDG